MKKKKQPTLKQKDPRHTLKQRREELGLGRAEIAEKIGVSTLTVRRWEEGISFPSVWYLPGIEDTYKTDRSAIRWLFEPERDSVLREGDPDGDVVYMSIVLMQTEHRERVEAIPLEMEEALENNDKDRLSALVQELKQIYRSRS